MMKRKDISEVMKDSRFKKVKKDFFRDFPGADEVAKQAFGSVYKEAAKNELIREMLNQHIPLAYETRKKVADKFEICCKNFKRPNFLLLGENLSDRFDFEERRNASVDILQKAYETDDSKQFVAVIREEINPSLLFFPAENGKKPSKKEICTLSCMNEVWPDFHNLRKIMSYMSKKDTKWIVDYKNNSKQANEFSDTLIKAKNKGLSVFISIIFGLMWGEEKKSDRFLSSASRLESKLPKELRKKPQDIILSSHPGAKVVGVAKLMSKIKDDGKMQALYELIGNHTFCELARVMKIMDSHAPTIGRFGKSLHDIIGRTYKPSSDLYFDYFGGY